MSHSKKPSLPSIQFLLHESPITTNNSIKQSPILIKPTPISSSTNNNNNNNNTHNNNNNAIIPSSTLVQSNKSYHRQTHSISSLPSELQQLSLSAPAHKNYDHIPERSENNQPSWMMMPPTSTTISTRPPGACHARSISEFSPISTKPLPPVIRNRHQTHRRSVSANITSNLDYMNTNSTNGNLPYINEQQIIRARTESPPNIIIDSTSNIIAQQNLFNALNIKEQQEPQKKKKEKTPPNKEYENVMVARDEQTGRYYCPFCNKAFNRPSSLRIHTYSHTGEKPFVCQEEGCGRQFSVQSNMRRHLRVHRLGRSKTTTKSTASYV